MFKKKNSTVSMFRFMLNYVGILILNKAIPFNLSLAGKIVLDCGGCAYEYIIMGDLQIK